MRWYLAFVILTLILGFVSCLQPANDDGERSMSAEEDESKERYRRKKVKKSADDDDADVMADYVIQTPPADYVHDYARVLNYSILFYEAQRSGKLPDDNHIKWRTDSCLDDVDRKGKDLTGGWYDAGDNVKFNFPMAWSTSVLAFGFIEFMDAYEEAGLTEDLLDSIKWPCDYFIKCHTKKKEYCYQVGDANVDHTYWQRPEDLTYEREAFCIKGKKKGSDVVSITAAALASCAVAFTEAGQGDLAEPYRDEAEELYKYATKIKGTYPADKYYKNIKWEDEMVYAATWLYLATDDADYLEEAEKMFDDYGQWGRSWAFSWGDAREGTKLLLYKITGDAKYKMRAMQYLDSISLSTRSDLYTPRGLFFRDDWGSLRYAAGAAFIALVAGKYDMTPKVYREFACNQTNYILGDNEHHSFVIGYGKDPPCRPHHRASSCPDLYEQCTYRNAMLNQGCNPHQLTGAVVGGPKKDDSWSDNRGDYYHNEVACDYNAAFQGAMAGLLQLKMDDQLPPACYILTEEV
ncbi:endoglucanase 4-like [Glandiceps talaboti]